MGTEQLMEKIREQRDVYDSLKKGDVSLVCYREFENGEWGTDDANYTNRLRLAYYLLYNKIDDEEAAAYLFQEELKDRERNSFQGIGSALRVLTVLLRRYNGDGRYEELFRQAKNANFDCACGYDPEDEVDDSFEDNSLLDGIYLCLEMDYKDVMADLVDEWKRDTETGAGWDDSNRGRLIEFNRFLGRDGENEGLYKELLEESLRAENGRVRDMISRYRDMIRYYVQAGDYDSGAAYCKMVIDTTNYKEIRTLRLFGDILEECLEVIAGMARDGRDLAGAFRLWQWTKGELEEKNRTSWYGDLYTKGIAAAKVMDEAYAGKLEAEYAEWMRKRWSVQG